MKRSLFVVALLMVLFLCGPVHAEDYGFLEGANSKLTRGAINIVTGWIEVPAEILKGYERGFMDNKLLGILTGIFSGFSRAFGRTASGSMDILTFWSADPDDNFDIGIYMNNEFAWESEDDPHYMFEPTFGDATAKPIANKFMRAMTNLFCGVAEIPGQIRKGYQEDTPGLGYAKGFWYWLSREAWGARDILTVFIPTPSDNVGTPFDEEMPWDAWQDTAN